MSTFKKAVKAFVDTVRTEKAPKWVAEPVRAVANRVVGWTALGATAAAAATNFTSVMPTGVRSEVTAAIGFATAAFMLVTKFAGEVARSKVFSPESHQAAVAVAQSASLRGGSASPSTSEILHPEGGNANVTGSDPSVLASSLQPTPTPTTTVLG